MQTNQSRFSSKVSRKQFLTKRNKTNLVSNGRTWTRWTDLELNGLHKLVSNGGWQRWWRRSRNRRSCSRQRCCDFGVAPHDLIDWGGAAETNHRIYQDNMKNRRRYSKVDRTPTHKITWFHRSNRSCVRPRRKEGETLLKLWGSTIRIT